MVTRIVFLLAVILLSCCKINNPLPDTLYEMTLTKKLQGEEALKFVNKLHFDAVTSLKTEVAFYKGNNTEATIYITWYSSPDQAREEGLKMIQKISPQNSVFIQGKQIDISGNNVYRCFGMGQTHYVFSKDVRLFWVSVTTIFAADFMEYYLSYL